MSLFFAAIRQISGAKDNRIYMYFIYFMYLNCLCFFVYFFLIQFRYYTYNVLVGSTSCVHFIGESCCADLPSRTRLHAGSVVCGGREKHLYGRFIG